jgi:spoIIIJ-associated protein
MIKIESANLQDAYEKAALHYSCSVTELQVEVLQHPNSGFLGFFKKSAIIVASCKKDFQKQEVKVEAKVEVEPIVKPEIKQEIKQEPLKEKFHKPLYVEEKKSEKIEPSAKQNRAPEQKILNDTILPTSFVSDQDDEYLEEELTSEQYKESYKNEFDKNYFYDEKEDADEYSSEEIVLTVKAEINKLFQLICFDIHAIDVKLYDESTLLVEISGEDSALLIGKEGYRYKALSYMIFNWINSKYQLQLRLEIAEFLKNQEESVSRYLIGVCETIEREGRAQTKILDGVLVQIALKQLRETYPDKYVAIRSTRDGLKFIIINDYNGY